MSHDVAAEYERYLARFEAELGAVELGAFAKYKGRLIKKMDLEEFRGTWGTYHELASHFLESRDRGDTINDTIVKLLRQHAAELLLAPLI